MSLQFPRGPTDVSLYFLNSLCTSVFVAASAAFGLQGLFPFCSSASPGRGDELLSLRWLQTPLIVLTSREIRLHSKAELAFPPPPVIRKQVATVTSSFQKFPSTPRSPFVPHPISCLKGDYLSGFCFFPVKPPRESKLPPFWLFLLYLYLFISFEEIKSSCEAVQGKFSLSLHFVWKLCCQRFKEELQVLGKERNGTAPSLISVARHLDYLLKLASVISVFFFYIVLRFNVFTPSSI